MVEKDTKETMLTGANTTLERVVQEKEEKEKEKGTRVQDLMILGVTLEIGTTQKETVKREIGVPGDILRVTPKKGRKMVERLIHLSEGFRNQRADPASHAVVSMRAFGCGGM